MKHSINDMINADMQMDKKIKLLNGYVKRSTKNKPLILENGCLNYTYSHYEVEEYRDIKIVKIYDMEHKVPFIEFDTNDILEKNLVWSRDTKYNALAVYLR